MAQPPRVVLDTSLVLSALVFGRGRVAALRHAWQCGRCLPLVSRVTAAELLRVLNYAEFKLSAADRENLLSDYLPYCQSVHIPARLPRRPLDRAQQPSHLMPDLARSCVRQRPLLSAV
jgi:predicted nucleic acid-binding protein